MNNATLRGCVVCDPEMKMIQIASGAQDGTRHGNHSEKFVKLDKYGQLYMDKILFESYFPVVFTCINEKKDIFIGVCCQNNEKSCKWPLGKTNAGNIVKMLRDKITIRQLLLDYSSGKISVDYAENEYSIAFNNSDWDEKSPYLPKEDSYMYAENGEFENEIDYFMGLCLQRRECGNHSEERNAVRKS